MMDVTLEEAYQEACMALGEATIRERLLVKQLRNQQKSQPEWESTPEETTEQND